jgi:hypothetical protein
MADTAGTYLSVDLGNGNVAIDHSCEGAVDVAYRRWIEKGEDTVLSLTLWCGDDIVISASHIESFILSTAKGREKHLDFQVEAYNHKKAAFGEGWGESD